jgi:hypothetical protein
MFLVGKRWARLLRAGSRAVPALGAVLAGVSTANADADESREVRVDPKSFEVVGRSSGPVNYYTVVESPEVYIHAAYRPSYKTTVLGYRIPEAMRKGVTSLHWKWRAITLPQEGNECASGKGDSAAVVYLTWRRGLKWYTIKYVWSSVGPKGQVCDKKRNPFRAQDTVVVESGPPLGEWQTVQVSPDTEYRNHFEGGDPKAPVPELVGIGIMSDGDQTASVSEADYADFTMVPK